jgi:hypothetical protein
VLVIVLQDYPVLLIEVYQPYANAYNTPYASAGCQLPQYAKHQGSASHCIICLRQIYLGQQKK